MSDFYYNRIVFLGKKEEMEKIKNKVKSEYRVFDFMKLVPLKKNNSDIEELWGAKSNAMDVETFEFQGKFNYKLVYTFTTIKNPPIKLLLSGCFYGTSFIIDYYDEDDFGRNCGTYIFNNQDYCSITYKEDKINPYTNMTRSYYKNSLFYLKNKWGMISLKNSDMFMIKQKIKFVKNNFFNFYLNILNIIKNRT